jgi:hypothetical protein
LQHVLVHEYLGNVLSIDEVPPWLLYGLAQNYESLRYVDLPASRRWTVPDKEQQDTDLREVVAAGVPMTLSRLLSFDRVEFHGVNEFGSSAYGNLVLAGSFVAFTKVELAQKSGLPENFLEKYCSELQAGGGHQAALESALPGADLAAVDGAWRAWIEARTGRRLAAAQ